MKSQLELTDRIINIANSVDGEGLDLVIGLRNKMYELLEIKPYNESTKHHESMIRWKRTADEIISDGYVYEGKSCTDRVIVFLGLANARNFETNFVKVHNKQLVHSVAEININNNWHIYDVASNQKPFLGQYQKGLELNGWYLWKKGKDAWDLELTDYDSIKKIK